MAGAGKLDGTGAIKAVLSLVCACARRSRYRPDPAARHSSPHSRLDSTHFTLDTASRVWLSCDIGVFVRLVSRRSSHRAAGICLRTRRFVQRLPIFPEDVVGCIVVSWIPRRRSAGCLLGPSRSYVCAWFAAADGMTLSRQASSPSHGAPSKSSPNTRLADRKA